MTRARVPQARGREAERVAARHALKALVDFKLGVAKESYGYQEAVSSALVVIGAAANALTAALGSTDAADLVEELASNLRDQAQGRLAPNRNGGAR